MRTRLHNLVLIISASALSLAQSAAPPAAKPAPAPAAEPTAIIHTTVGDLHCTLFPKVAPLGVANFIGLAKGTKDWTAPSPTPRSMASPSMTAPSSIA
jgi:peptidyl-prolyl cis-trans isomerase A (cyclophilin A)